MSTDYFSLEGDIEIKKIKEYSRVSKNYLLFFQTIYTLTYFATETLQLSDYINKKEEYTLNAALIINLKPVIGIIYAPAKERLFYSYGKNLAFEINKGKKIILNCQKKNVNEIIGLENSRATPLEVEKIYKKYKVTKTLKMSSSLKFCTLAAGEADIYAANARAYEWDIAAGHAILEHSGGNVTNHKSESFLYGKNKYKNLPLLALRSTLVNK